MTKLDHKKLALLHEKILEFSSIRNWNPSAQNIAKSVVIEASELLEHFQWDNDEDGLKKKNNVEIGHEMADVIWYLFLLANKLNIDLVDAIGQKLEHNEQKYPSKMFVDGHNKEFYYSQKKKYRQIKK